MSETLTKTQRKAAIKAPYRFGLESRKLEEWVEMQPQRFIILGINPPSYNCLRLSFQVP
jgi:hypothetical protein